ncbi:carbonic anhydrase [Streptomyces sp. bgisy100]|uniref:carbonic anhydrase n=1 Tax=Streptomyces sp. bgisy100 TaxID=3413783 RepID=UPI003D72E8E1
MHTFVKNVRAFRRHVATDPGSFTRLTNGQAPRALFISCSDSRVVPALITGARPGELFELRTVGGIVPGHRPDRPSCEAATVEYAVAVLRVPDIVVCGHSHCAAVGAMARHEDLSATPAVRDWLAQTSPAPSSVTPTVPDLSAAVQEHVVRQLGRLRGHPSVSRRIAAGRLRLHGWFYELATGSVLVHRPESKVFLPL